MNEKYNIEDKHEIASIINHCLNDGYCDASMLARRITQAGYGNNNRVRNEFAQKLKANELLMIVNAFDLSELINVTLKEYEFAEQDSEEPDKFENYDKLKSQIAFFKEETERAKLSLNKKIEEYNQLSFKFCQQSYEKYKLLSNFVEKLKKKSYVNNYCEEVIRINDIDKILEESKNDN